MQYHALALAETMADVDLIGYAGSPPHQAVREHSAIKCHLLHPLKPLRRARPPRWLLLGYLILKVLHQHFQLLRMLLFEVERPDFLLVQNPPAIPTLGVVLLVARLRSAKFVIDWHNFGFAMLALKLGANHLAVRFARRYEQAFGRLADAHFCVSRAMQSELTERWRIRHATVLYDHPAEQFSTTQLHARHELFRRLQDSVRFPEEGLQSDVGCGANCGEDGAYIENTAVTALHVPKEGMTGEILAYGSRSMNRDHPGLDPSATSPAQGPPSSLLRYVRLRSDRPAVLVSSTSWTEDEDFSLLLESVAECDQKIRLHEEESGDRGYPDLLLLITGKGPLREEFERRIKNLNLGKVHLRTLWLSPEDYPLLLGSADLGICLHRSATGLDLPMKVADMFGSGLPVCAFDYGPTLGEQVQHGDNGLLFSNSSELADQLCELFRGFPGDTPLLDRLRHNVNGSVRCRWADGWKESALSALMQL
jgi:beta-1,4-mannosyltransferase